MNLQIDSYDFDLEKSNLNYLIYIYETKLLLPKYTMPHLCIDNNSIIDSDGIYVKFSEFKKIDNIKQTNIQKYISLHIINITEYYYSYFDIIIGIRINTSQQNEITFIIFNKTQLLKSMSDDINHVIDNVYIGNMCASIDSELLDSYNIESIVQVLNKFEPPFKEKYKYHIIPIEDSPNIDISIYFEDFIKFIEQNKNSKILIHCQHGSSRSGSFLILYLMKFKKMTYDEAFRFVKSKRYCVNPNRGFRDFLIKFSG